MLSPHGRDRVVERPDGTVELRSPYPKGWDARASRGATRSEHPGTAILWDEVCYEVIVAEESGGVSRYELAPWRDEHTIRRLVVYDEPSEGARIAEDHRRATRRRRSPWIAIFGFLIGNLPAGFQEHVESEFGVSAGSMTAQSTIPYLLFGLYCGTHLPIRNLPAADSPLPGWLITLGCLWFMESVVRLRFVLTGRPLASSPGWLAALCWSAFGLAMPGATRTLPKDSEKLRSSSPGLQSAEEARLDRFHLWEPMLSLLNPADQRRLVELYDFDPLRVGRSSSIVILIICLAGAASMLLAIASEGASLSRLLSLTSAAWLAGEQGRRLFEISAGRPAGSILGRLIRPLVSDLFD